MTDKKHFSRNRRRLLMGAGAGLLIAHARARADILDALLEGLSAGYERGAATPRNYQGFLAKQQAQQARLLGPEDDANSLQAEDLFRSNRQMLAAGPFSPERRTENLLAFKNMLRDLQNGMPRNLNFLQAAEAGKKLAPILNRIDQAWAYDENMQEGKVYVPARSAVQFGFSGYCLDQRLPAPKGNDNLRLMPLSRVTDKKTAAAMSGLSRRAKNYVAGTSEFGRGMAQAELQSLVWALREMQLGAQPRLSDKQQALLREFTPKQETQDQDFMEGLLRSVGESVGTDFGKHFGGLSDLANMGSVKERMNELASNSAPNTKPVGTPYTLLQPGVAAKIVGTAPLKASGMIVNGTNKPVVLDLHDHVAEAANQTQRVLISDASGGGLPRADQDIIRGILDEEKQLAANHAFKWLPDGMKGFGLTPKSLAMGKLLEMTPLLGNAISAAELATGYEWTEWAKPESERQKMNAAEMLLAAAGTIPGAGNLAKLVGKEAVPGILMKAGQMVDSAGILPDAAGVVFSSTAQDIYNKSLAAWESTNDPVVRVSAAQMEPIVLQSYQAVAKA